MSKPKGPDPNPKHPLAAVIVPGAPVEDLTVTADRLVTGKSTRGIFGHRRRKEMHIKRTRTVVKPIDASTFEEPWAPFFPLLVEDTRDQRATVRVVVDGATWGKGNVPRIVSLRLAFSNGEPDQTFQYEIIRPTWWRRLIGRK